MQTPKNLFKEIRIFHEDIFYLLKTDVYSHLLICRCICRVSYYYYYFNIRPQGRKKFLNGNRRHEFLLIVFELQQNHRYLCNHKFKFRNIIALYNKVLKIKPICDYIFEKIIIWTMLLIFKQIKYFSVSIMYAFQGSELYEEGINYFKELKMICCSLL